MNVAVFGGSFNPPHVAHVLACALVLASEDVDRVLVVPTFQHPFAKELAPVRRPRRDVRARDGRAAERRGLARRGGARRREPDAAHARAPRRGSTPTGACASSSARTSSREAPRWFGFDAITEARAAARARRAPGSTRAGVGPAAPAGGVEHARCARPSRAARGTRSRALVPRAVLDVHPARRVSMARRRETADCSVVHLSARASWARPSRGRCGRRARA